VEQPLFKQFPANRRPFRMEAAWFSHEDFGNLVRRVWEQQDQSLQSTLASFKESCLGRTYEEETASQAN